MKISRMLNNNQKSHVYLL